MRVYQPNFYNLGGREGTDKNFNMLEPIFLQEFLYLFVMECNFSSLSEK